MAYKILIADDDADIAETMKKRLLAEGYQVAVARDGEEAISGVRQENPDLVLLDLIMPKLNGFEVLKQIRQEYNQRWIPVIIISAKTELESLKQSYNLEADHYLTKPCRIEDVLRGIETMISLIPLRIKKNDGLSF